MLAKNISLFALFFVSLLVSGKTGPDWGATGHRVIGEIAEVHLTKKAKKKVTELLRGHGLAFVSTYGDDIKSDKRYDKYDTWHYVNYPFDKSYQESDKNPKGDIIMGIDTCIKKLKKKDTSPEDQEFYLKFLIHLIGDLHQPLHVAQADDKGGNDLQVRWFNDGSNLHRVWDSNMIDSYKMSYTEMAENISEGKKDMPINASRLRH
ncbi:MAG: S1/P1 nuclease [Flavobacteriaceae bacterium]|nr:S1/P1 nuclease [Flavobacteriaceae bacterium]